MKSNKKTLNIASNKKNLYSLNSNREYFYLAIILFITLISFFPTFFNDFTNWDDTAYVTQNKAIQQLTFENIKLYFSTFFVSNYHPLTMISLAIDYAIGKDSPFIYHLSALIFHFINILLVYIFVKNLLKSQITALVTAVLFAVHTIHVEPVAWISDRKDLLSTSFFLLSLISYVRYLKNNKIVFYLISILIFLFALLSKATAVSLAFTIIAINYFYNQKLFSSKKIVEYLPYFILSIAFGLLAIKAQSSTKSIDDNTVFQAYERILFASYGFTNYILKLILPINLSAIYPYPPKTDGAIPAVFWIYPFIVAIIIGLIVYIWKFSRIINFAIIFFIVNIILLLQLIPVGSAIMADRYAYISSIGFFIIIGYIYEKFYNKKNNISLTINIILGLFIFILIVFSHNRTKIWKDSLTLWDDVISKYKHVTVAWVNHGNVLFKSGNFKAAFEDYTKAIELNTPNSEPYLNRGTCRKEMGDLDGAMEDLNKAISINPSSSQAYYNRGGVFTSKLNYDKAMNDYNKAIELDSLYAEAFSNRGNVKLNMKKVYEAIKDYNKAISLKPNFADAYSNRGIAKNLLGDYQGSMTDFSQVIRINPNDGLGFYLRGMTKFQMGNRNEACQDLQFSYQLGFPDAEKALATYCTAN